jgi:hypothetical protein
MFAAEFFTSDKKPKCISAQFGKPLLSLPKHMKLTINMHDSIKKIIPKPTLDIVNIPTNIKYTIATAPTNSVYFNENNYKDVESVFFTKATLTDKMKHKLRANLVDLHNDIVTGYDKTIANTERQAQLFFRLSNGIQSKNSKIIENHEKIVDIFARMNEAINPTKKSRIIIVKDAIQKEVKLETRLTNLYREFWQNEQFLENIKFTDICTKKNISQMWDKNEIVAEIENVQKSYEMLKTRSGVVKIKNYVNYMAEIKAHEKASLQMDTVQLADYTFKTVDNKQCIRDTLLTVCTGATKTDKDTSIYHFGFNVMPFYTDIGDQMRFIEFFRDFVNAKKLTKDRDTFSYTYVSLMYEMELRENPDISSDAMYKLLIKLLMRDFNNTTSYAFNMEKRPDCELGTLAHEYVKELMIMQSVETKNPNLMRLFYYLFTLDHPGNRMQPNATVDDLLNAKSETNLQAIYEGVFYKSASALPLRIKMNGKYVMDKQDLMYLFCNLCENLDVMDYGCKNGDSLDICETGYYDTPKGSPRSSKGSPGSSKGSPRSSKGSPGSIKKTSSGSWSLPGGSKTRKQWH